MAGVLPRLYFRSTARFSPPRKTSLGESARSRLLWIRGRTLAARIFNMLLKHSLVTPAICFAGDDNISSFRDIKGPVDFSSNFNLLLIIGILAVVAAIVFWLISRRKKTKSAPAVPMKSAYETAWEQLEALKAKDLIAKGRIKEYHIEISDIIRCYLEARFSLNAPEMTTEEFLNSLSEGARLEIAHKELLREFLGYCDMVKFAKYTPETREIELVWESALNFLRQTNIL